MDAVPNERNEVIRRLRDTGMESREAIRAFDAWAAGRERMVESLGRTPEARLGFEVDRAGLYAEGGYINEALDTLYDALYVAQQENEPELEERIRTEIAKLDAME